MFLRIIFVFFLLINFGYSLNNTSKEINKIYYLKDKNFKLEDLINKKFQKYEKDSSEYFKFPFTNKSSYWIKVNIKNEDLKNKRRIIYLTYPDIHSVQFFEKNNSSKIFENISYKKIQNNRLFNCILEFESNKNKTLLIKIDNHLGPIIFNLQMSNETEFYKSEQKMLFIHSVFIGMMLLAMIYFLLAFIIMKKYIYIFYILHIFSFVIFQIFIQGYPKEFILDIQLVDEIKISMALIASCTYALFIVNFFKESLSIIYKRTIYFIIFAVFINIFLYLFGVISPHPLAIFGILEYIVVFFASLSVYKKKDKNALYIVISSFILVIGALFHSLAIIFQIIPLYEYTLYSLSYANILEVLIILFMFITYFKHTFKEKEKIYLQKLNLERDFSKQLENKVKDKTIELEKEKQKAEELARTDELTQVFNRLAFNENIKYFIKESKRFNFPLTLMMIDIDYFKKINDSYGHEVGDIVLQKFSGKLISLIRETDLIARIGGEEFVMIFPHTNLENSLIIANKILTSLRDFKIPYKNSYIKVTASFGLSELKKEDNISSLMNRCDEALYNAKNTGRNKIEFI